MKAKHLMLNGEFRPAEIPSIMHGNRGLLFGEVIWQNMRAGSSKVFFFDAYFEHLCDEMKTKDICLPATFTNKILEHDVFLLLQKCRIYRGALVRITIFRNGNDKFFYNRSTPVSVLIEAESYSEHNYTLNETGLKMAVCEELVYPSQKPDFLPGLQTLGFTAMSKYFNDYSADNLYLINNRGNIFQAPDANVMFIKDNTLLIPSEKSLYTYDILCDFVEDAAVGLGMDLVRDAEIQFRDLDYFDEAILIDSVHGIRWVQAFGEKRFYNRIAAKLTHALSILAEKV